MRNLDKMFNAIKTYQQQANLDGHGATWRTALEQQTAAAYLIAGEDAGEKMIVADPTWELFCGRKHNEDYERIYLAGEGMCSAEHALKAKTDAECEEWAGCAARLIALALGEEE